MIDPEELTDEVAARLTRDATTWGGEPSEAGQTALRARLATLPPNKRSFLPWFLPLAAACALVTTFFALDWAAEATRPLPRRSQSARSSPEAGGATKGALAPLRGELAGLTQDAEALARGVWGQVPAPLRRVIR